MGKVWSAADKALMDRLRHEKVTHKSIAVILGRTEAAVNLMCEKMDAAEPLATRLDAVKKAEADKRLFFPKPTMSADDVDKWYERNGGKFAYSGK